MSKEFQKATFGAGCFWGVEEAFRQVEGVRKTTVGYMGGDTEDPSYEEVCSDETGHVEVVQLEYDPDEVSYQELLKTFFYIHDPTTINRQGPDVGTQYKSVIFYHNEQQREIAEAYVDDLERSGKFEDQIVTEIRPAERFYRAEEYHQKYIQKKGGGCGL